jgi:hypothetical protein
VFVLVSRDPLTNEQRKGRHGDVTGNTVRHGTITKRVLDEIAQIQAHYFYCNICPVVGCHSRLFYQANCQARRINFTVLKALRQSSHLFLCETAFMPMLSRYTGKTIITICRRSVVSVRRCAWHAAQQYLPQTFSITSSAMSG